MPFGTPIRLVVVEDQAGEHPMVAPVTGPAHQQASGLSKPIQGVAVRVAEHLQRVVHAVGGGIVHRPGLTDPSVRIPFLLIRDELRVEDTWYFRRGRPACTAPNPWATSLRRAFHRRRRSLTLAFMAPVTTEACPSSWCTPGRRTAPPETPGETPGGTSGRTPPAQQRPPRNGRPAPAQGGTRPYPGPCPASPARRPWPEPGPCGTAHRRGEGACQLWPTSSGCPPNDGAGARLQSWRIGVDGPDNDLRYHHGGWATGQQEGLTKVLLWLQPLVLDGPIQPLLTGDRRTAMGVKIPSHGLPRGLVTGNSPGVAHRGEGHNGDQVCNTGRSGATRLSWGRGRWRRGRRHAYLHHRSTTHWRGQQRKVQGEGDENGRGRRGCPGQRIHAG